MSTGSKPSSGLFDRLDVPKMDFRLHRNTKA
jgi:hypothetical protein